MILEEYTHIKPNRCLIPEKQITFFWQFESSILQGFLSTPPTNISNRPFQPISGRVGPS